MIGKLPNLITFDGEARSGKGTIVQATKDYLRDECGYKVMLIDAGQVFRVLVVAATRAGIDITDAEALDTFLTDPIEVEKCVQFVKSVYHMDKTERDGLLYTNEIGANSAVVGARPLSQKFKDELLKKWLYDARIEGYEIVLLDGRALEEVGTMLQEENLCHFAMGLYFTCEPTMGARRTLGFASKKYETLSDDELASVEQLVAQIQARNQSDSQREIQPIVAPIGPTLRLPNIAAVSMVGGERFMCSVDTSAEMTKSAMTQPIAELVARKMELDSAHSDN